MYFFDTTTKQGLCQDADYFADSTTSNYPLVDKARNATEWLRKVGVWIWQATSNWQFDDSNFTTLPEATTTLVDGQQDVTLPTSIFKIERAEILDQNGDGHELVPFDPSQVDVAMTEFLKTPGLPVYYDVVGNSLKLFPSVSQSNVTLTNGLRIYIARDVDPFVSTDTTKQPGFSSYFHRIISVGMALDFAIKHGLTDKVSILNKILYGDPSNKEYRGLKQELQEAYGSRNRAQPTGLQVKESHSGV